MDTRQDFHALCSKRKSVATEPLLQPDRNGNQEPTPYRISESKSNEGSAVGQSLSHPSRNLFDGRRIAGWGGFVASIAIGLLTGTASILSSSAFKVSLWGYPSIPLQGVVSMFFLLCNTDASWRFKDTELNHSASLDLEAANQRSHGLIVDEDDPAWRASEAEQRRSKMGAVRTPSNGRVPGDKDISRSCSVMFRRAVQEYSAAELALTFWVLATILFPYMVGSCKDQSARSAYFDDPSVDDEAATLTYCLQWTCGFAGGILICWALIYLGLIPALRRGIRRFQGKEKLLAYTSGLVRRWMGIVMFEFFLASWIAWHLISHERETDDDFPIYDGPPYNPMGIVMALVVMIHPLALAVLSEFAFGAGLVSSYNVSQMKLELHELLMCLFICLATMIFVVCFAVFPTQAFSDAVTSGVWVLGYAFWLNWFAAGITLLVVAVPRARRMRQSVGKSGFHVFLSYRRAQSDFAARIKMGLTRHGLKVFFDTDPEDGLGAGNFQERLEYVLFNTPVIIPVLTPSPAGPGWRADLSSLDAIKEAHRSPQDGWPRSVTYYDGKPLAPNEKPAENARETQVDFYDWCEREMMVALSRARTDPTCIVLPVAKGSMDIGWELHGRGGLPDSLQDLGDLNIRLLHDDLFDKSLEVVNNYIQSHLLGLSDS